MSTVLRSGDTVATTALVVYALVFALMPVGRASELPVLIAAVTALVVAIRSRRTAVPSAARFEAAKLLIAIFAAYWLPMAISAIDAVDAGKAWSETAADLRLLPFSALPLLMVARDARWLERLRALVAAVLALWVLDALIQAATGYSLGGRLAVDRIAGVFGNDNLKLGPALAALSPFLLVEAHARHGRAAALVAGSAAGLAILLAGARASWLVYAIVVAALLWRASPRKRDFATWLASCAVLALAIGTAAYAMSDRLQARVERTLAAVAGTEAGVDHALAFRLPIWQAATAMAVDHPVNGVGVRSYRHAYPHYAAADDRWVDRARAVGAYHPHQLVLEIAAELGAIGLVAWLAAAGLMVRAWRRAGSAARDAAFAPGIALVAMLFPLNTHPAFYSSFWAIVLWVLVAWYVAALARDARDDGADARPAGVRREPPASAVR